MSKSVIVLDTLPGIYNRSRLSLLPTPRRQILTEAPRQSPSKYNCWTCGSDYEKPFDYLVHIKECAYNLSD